jgi:hypothetical protein
MRHLPSASVRADDGTYLLAKQDNNGDTFVISTSRLPWGRSRKRPAPRNPASRHRPVHAPTAADIAEAMTSLPRLDRTDIDAADNSTAF